ncbi:MAG: cobalamin biosynthetic protein CobC [Paracoccaceae bacterium]|jgi:cobalamin biosynthetic protein CobC
MPDLRRTPTLGTPTPNTPDQSARDHRGGLGRLTLGHGATLAGGSNLFRLHKVANAAARKDRLAQHHIWTRIFPYSDQLLRLGLPHPDGWDPLGSTL